VLSNLSQRQAVEDEVRKATAAAQASLYDERRTASEAAPSALRGLDARFEEASAMPATPARSGWVPWYADNALHVLGWLQPAAGGPVRGVELDLPALIARLRSVLPADLGPGERYVLRDDRGAILHEAGAADAGADLNPVVRLEFAAALPNWEVVAWSLPAAGSNAGGAGWFVLAALLVGVFVIAILSGGLLLLTQARRSEAEAALKTSFVANVSHEFKTPLTTIRLYAELLADGRVSEPSRRDDYLRTIGRETQRLARLVGNVLDFSRLEQGRKQYRLEPLDLAGVVRAVLDTQAPRVAEAGLRLGWEPPADALSVTTDRDALEQIVLNLLDNACKYAAAGGEAVVSVKPGPRGGAVVSVADRGPGVPPDHAEAIFEKFHRVDDTLTSDQGGAGLGLGIARQLARGLGGDLRYEAREGGGAVFILTLP
jgi:signal transduction histidine kinase